MQQPGGVGRASLPSLSLEDEVWGSRRAGGESPMPLCRAPASFVIWRDQPLRAQWGRTSARRGRASASVPHCCGRYWWEGHTPLPWQDPGVQV